MNENISTFSDMDIEKIVKIGRSNVQKYSETDSADLRNREKISTDAHQKIIENSLVDLVCKKPEKNYQSITSKVHLPFDGEVQYLNFFRIINIDWHECNETVQLYIF